MCFFMCMLLIRKNSYIRESFLFTSLSLNHFFVDASSSPHLSPSFLLQKQIKQMLEMAEKHDKNKISTRLISKIYSASSEDEAQKCIALIMREKGNPWYVSSSLNFYFLVEL